MGYVVRMPKLGLEMEQGTLLEWAVDTGESVSEDDLVAEIESEKSIGEIDAREDGVLRRTYLDVGDAVPPGTPIGIVAAAEVDISDLESEAEAELEGDAEAEAGGEAEAAGTAEEPTAESTATAGPDAATSGDTTDDVKASPRARKRAEELGVDLTTVEGTGPQDSITEDDVETAAESVADEAAEPASAPARVEPSLADRYRLETAVLDTDDADALLDAATAARDAVNEDASVTDIFLLVVSAALSACPRFNATYADATHQIHEGQHVAVVGAEKTAVVAEADSRSLSAVIEARDGGEGDDVPTPTFTLSNAAPSDEAAAGRVVNPPAVAALAFDPVGQRATPTDDGVRLDRLVTLRLTYDTRAIDPTDARAFLDAVAEAAGRAPALVTESYLD
jgi:pyruvate/2-oxoglutarate dehydrogenase complex dihydrolipoamide acyltransferase (E2) component